MHHDHQQQATRNSLLLVILRHFHYEHNYNLTSVYSGYYEYDYN